MDAVATRDGPDKASIHYLFRFLHPQDFAIRQQPDGRSDYAITLQAELLDTAGKVISQSSRDLNGYLNAHQMAEIKEKCFGVEGRVGATVLVQFSFM